MNAWNAAIDILLTALAVGCFLWAMRSWVLLRRLERGLRALRQGSTPPPVRHTAQDREAVLVEFDQLVQELEDHSARTRIAEVLDVGEPAEEHSADELAATLRPALISTRSYATLLESLLGPSADATSRACLERLSLQVAGVLRLLDSGREVDELRTELSHLQRRVARVPIPGSLPLILLADRDAPWSRALADLLTLRGYGVLTAGDPESARLFTRSLRPLLVLANAALPSVGWQVVRSLQDDPTTRELPVWLYEPDADQLSGRVWMPDMLWAWPPSDVPDCLHDWTKPPEGTPAGLGARPLRIAGPNGLAAELTRYLARLGWATEPWPDCPAPGLGRMVAVGPANGQPVGRPDDAPRYILVVRDSLLDRSGNELAEAMAESARPRPQPITALFERLLARIESLRPDEANLATPTASETA